MLPSEQIPKSTRLIILISATVLLITLAAIIIFDSPIQNQERSLIGAAAFIAAMALTRLMFEKRP